MDHDNAHAPSHELPGEQMLALLFDRTAVDTSATRVGLLPIPVPGPGQVLIEVSHAGVNFKDIMARRGDTGYVSRWPFVPGLEAAGTIVAVGDNVHDRKPGDVVSALTNHGALAQYVLARAALTALVPAGLDLALAAAAPGAMTTAALLLKHYGRIRDGDTVLVHSAAGAVGTAIAAMARNHAGVTLIGTVGSPSRVPAALVAGYDHVAVRSQGLADEILGYLVELQPAGAGARGVNLILDPQATEQLDLDIAVLDPGGRIVIFGNASGSDLAPPPAIGVLISSNASLGGFSLAALSNTRPTLVSQAIASVLYQLNRGNLHLDLTHLDGLDDVADAHQALATGRGDTKYITRMPTPQQPRPTSATTPDR